MAGGTSSPESFDPSDQEFSVDVAYDRKLKNPVLSRRIEEVRPLDDLLILRAPWGTNFILSEDEARELVKLLPEAERPRM